MIYCPNCGCPCEETETICLLCDSQLQFSTQKIATESEEIIPPPAPRKQPSRSTTHRKRKKRKAKRFMVTAVVILTVCILLSGAFLFLMNRNGNGENSIKEVLWKNAEENITINQNADGTNTISVLSPDYSQILSLILRENPEQQITANLLKKAIAAHPELKTVYSFQVNNTEPETIRNMFEETIVKELLISSILEMPVNIEE